MTTSSQRTFTFLVPVTSDTLEHATLALDNRLGYDEMIEDEMSRPFDYQLGGSTYVDSPTEDNDPSTDYTDRIAREAATSLLEMHGLNDGSDDPLVEFAWELGSDERSSQNWTYEAGLEAIVREAIMIDRANR